MSLLKLAVTIALALLTVAFASSMNVASATTAWTTSSHDTDGSKKTVTVDFARGGPSAVVTHVEESSDGGITWTEVPAGTYDLTWEDNHKVLKVEFTNAPAAGKKVRVRGTSDNSNVTQTSTFS